MDRSTLGWLNGFLGVLIFSGSLPATRLAVIDFDPVFLTVARAGIAGLLGLGLLLVTRQRVPSRADLVALTVTAVGVVAGFPLLTALALQHVTSAHATISSACCRSPPRSSPSSAGRNGRSRCSGSLPASARRSWPVSQLSRGPAARWSATG
jgi:hypothetical protein